MRPLMKCTLRESRSSFATAMGHAFPLRRAPARAAASCGRRSSASAPLLVSTSVNSAATSKPRETPSTRSLTRNDKRLRAPLFDKAAEVKADHSLVRGKEELSAQYASLMPAKGPLGSPRNGDRSREVLRPAATLPVAARAGNVRPPTGRKSAHRAGPGTSPKPFRHFRELNLAVL